MANQELYKEALEAINNLFGDTSVSKQDAYSNLQNLRDDIDSYLDALETDIELEDREAMNEEW